MIGDLTTLELESALYEVLDPETGVNVVDLGLIYGLSRDGGAVRVTMTLTTRACPAGAAMVEGVKRRLEQIDGVEAVDIEVTFDPTWTPDRITPEGREQLGWG